MKFFVLDGQTPVQVANASDWLAWRQRNADKLQVARIKTRGALVSTLFIGFHDAVFETMVFGGPLDKKMLRAKTWDEALENHKAMVATVRDQAKVEAENNADRTLQ
jgi:hypothetical protein